MTAPRDVWTTYATQQGLIRPAVAIVAPRPHKYGAQAVYVDGVRFASKKEAGRFLELRLMQKAGAIADLECQPVFPLDVVRLYGAHPTAPRVIDVVHIGRYTADFRYTNCVSGEVMVEDVKSTATATTAYKLRKKLAEAIHGITVIEV